MKGDYGGQRANMEHESMERTLECQAAVVWPQERRVAFFDWVEAQGYNMLSVASHYLNRESEGRGEGWDTPDLWPL